MSAHEPEDTVAGIPLEAPVAELRRRCEAVARLQGGSTYLEEERRIFEHYVAESGLALPLPPEELGRPPDEEGNEHQVWFRPSSSSFLKATWPDFFGLQVIYRPGEEPKASPIDYLERWVLHNELFGDDVRLLGIVEIESMIRLVITQPAIAGVPASLDEIDLFFETREWKKFKVEDEVAYFHPKREVVVSDTHRANLIMMNDGLLAPIDLRVQLLKGPLLDTVRKLCS